MSDPAPVASRDIDALIAIMARLRTPGSGCPWDLAQTFESIAPFTQEEAAEVADAILRGDREDLCEELGDLLLQVVFHARMAEEEGSFAFGDVVEAITAKLIRRHPHVFGDAAELSEPEVNALWASIKAAEKAARLARRPDASEPGLLDGVLRTNPALTRAVQLQRKAATVGFDWQDAQLVLDKIAEEIAELRAAMTSAQPSEIADETGDVLFAIANLARHLGIDPERALHGSSDKFERRFGHIERQMRRRPGGFARASLDEMETLWNEAKALERKPGA